MVADALAHGGSSAASQHAPGAAIRGRRRFLGQRGQSLVEFSLVFPLLLLILSVMLDLSLVFYSYASLGNAVRQGVRYGSIWTNANDDTTIRNYVSTSASSGVSIVNDASHIIVSAVQSASNSTSVASGSRTSGNLLTVEVRHDYATQSPILSAIIPSIPMVISATGIIE